VLAFLTPWAALAGLAVVVPVAAAAVRERRARAVRGVLGLAPPAGHARIAVGAALAAAFALLAVAFAQPVVRLHDPILSRTDAEAYVVFDVSRSMLAAPAAGSPTRFDRAVRAAIALRTALGDVPTGVASLTDRPVVHLFPSGDASVYDAVVARSVGIERPPPKEASLRATDYGALDALARDNYYAPRSARRLAVLLTDGESKPFDRPFLVRRLSRAGIGLLVVRFWAPGERVFAADGSPEAYRPDPGAGQELDRLAAGFAGGTVFAEADRAALAAAARRSLSTGPAVETGETVRAVAVGPYVALAAALPLALLLLRGVSLPRPPRRRGSPSPLPGLRARTGSARRA
jgi:hypothetical protein